MVIQNKCCPVSLLHKHVEPGNTIIKVIIWLFHYNNIVDICVPCPFLKVQWVNQESVIVTFPSHVHL